jgi:hypothetical protein
MTLSAKAQQDFFVDYLGHLGNGPEDPYDEGVRTRVRAMADVRGKTINCRQYVLGVYRSDLYTLPGGREAWDAYRKQGRELQALFMDTPERTRAFWESERPLVATGYPSIRDDQYRQECLDLGLNPDILPN